MRRNCRARLTPFQKQIYDRSTTTTAIELDPTPQLYAAVKTLPVALAAAQQSRVATLSQTIVNHICSRLGVRTVQVRVHGIRPSNCRGELHGLYTQYSGGSKNDSIQVWVRTAKRQQTVAFRTFLRTLLHEVCHHLDYTYFHFRESYHTEGFFQRESSLFRTLLAPPAHSATHGAVLPRHDHFGSSESTSLQVQNVHADSLGVLPVSASIQGYLLR